MNDLPDSWDDEPWPLEDPVPARGLRPVNWSDTHDNAPQVADLADEAWQYAVDHGISMERALVELQRQAQYDREVWGTGSGVMLNGIRLWSSGSANSVYVYNSADFVDIVNGSSA